MKDRRFDPITPQDMWAEWEENSEGARSARQRMIDRQTGKNRDVSAAQARRDMIKRQKDNPTRRKYRDG